MKIREIINGIYCYKVTIKVKHGKSFSIAKSIIFANGISEAKTMLIAMYGDDAVVSVIKVSENDLKEAVQNRQAPKPVPRILPTDYTHALAQNAFLNKLKRNALQVKPTIDDLRAAQDDFEAEQKRVNREYEEALKDREKWAAIRKRRANL